jgi:hypothetical protein
VEAVGYMEAAVLLMFARADSAPPDVQQEVLTQYSAVVEGSFGRAHLGSVCLTLPGGRPCGDTCPLAVAIGLREHSEDE